MPYKKEKAVLLNDPYITQQISPQEMIGSNRVLRSQLMKIFEIYANECFVEAAITYLGHKGYIKKLMTKLNELLSKHLQD